MLFAPIAIAYLVFKAAFLAGLVKAFTSSNTLSHHPIAMAALYTLGIGILSYVYFHPSVLQMMDVSIENRELWLATTFVAATVYFWLLSRLDGGGTLWWGVMILGIGLLVIY